jgi:group I intron endonuclease
VRGHYRALSAGNHKNAHLQAAWKKYGAETFEAEVLESCAVGNVKAREQVWLDSVKEIGTPVFNKHFNATGIEKGYRFSAAIRSKHLVSMRSSETRTKMSNSARTRTNMPGEHARLASLRRGKPNLPETRAKISAANRGKVRSLEARANISKGLLGNTHFLGKKHTDETRAKISANNGRHWQGKMLSLEHRMKIGAGLIGRVFSKESLERMSKVQKAQPPEVRAKQGVALKAHYKANPEKCRKRSIDAKAMWANPIIRAKMSAGLREAWKRRKSNKLKGG